MFCPAVGPSTICGNGAAGACCQRAATPRTTKAAAIATAVIGVARSSRRAPKCQRPRPRRAISARYQSRSSKPIRYLRGKTITRSLRHAASRASLPGAQVFSLTNSSAGCDAGHRASQTMPRGAWLVRPPAPTAPRVARWCWPVRAGQRQALAGNRSASVASLHYA